MSYILHTKITTDADLRGLEKYDSKIKQVEKSGTSLGSTLKSLGTVLAAGASVYGIVKMAEDYGEMSGLLKSAGDRMGKDLAYMQGIVRDTAAAVSEDAFTIARLYSSASMAVQSFGGDINDADKITKSLSASLKLSGATASETTMVLEQASKMFASGEVNSRAFLGIAVKAPVLLNKLSEKFGMSSKAMKKALEDETISMEKLLRTIGSVSDELVTEFQKGPMNFSHFMSQIRNEALYFFGIIEEETEILSTTFKTILMVIRSLTSSIQGVVKVVGGWSNAMRLLIIALVMFNKQILLFKAQQLVTYLQRVAIGAFAAGKGFVAAARGLLTVRGAIRSVKAAASFGASILVGLLIGEFFAMAQGKANLIGYGLYLLELAIVGTVKSIVSTCQYLFDLIMGWINAVWSKISMLLDKVTALGKWMVGAGGAEGQGIQGVDYPTSIIPKGVDGLPGINHIINNNQSVKIEIAGTDDVQKTTSAIHTVLRKVNFEPITQEGIDKRMAIS